MIRVGKDNEARTRLLTKIKRIKKSLIEGTFMEIMGLPGTF